MINRKRNTGRCFCGIELCIFSVVALVVHINILRVLHAVGHGNGYGYLCAVLGFNNVAGSVFKHDIVYYLVRVLRRSLGIRHIINVYRRTRRNNTGFSLHLNTRVTGSG